MVEDGAERRGKRMTGTNEIDLLLAQETRLRFESFGLDTAWELGTRLRAQA